MLKKTFKFLLLLIIFTSFASAQSTDVFGDVAGNLFNNIVSVLIFVLLGAAALSVVGWAIYYFVFYRRSFNVLVKIYSARADDPYIIIDKAAYLTDRKSKTTYIKLWELKKELELPPFNIVQTSNKGDIIELYRKSENDFSFLTKPKIDKEYIIKSDGKQYPMKKFKQKQVEPDYYYYFKRKGEDTSWISPESLFSKLLQMAPILIPGALMLIFFLFFINSLPEILDKLISIIDKLDTLEGIKRGVNATIP